MIFRCALLASLLAVCLCRNIDTNVPLLSGRVIGGHNADVGEFPFIVSLQVEISGKRHMCGGSILNERWILTAAHCVIPLSKYDRVFVVAGKHDITKTEGSEQAVIPEAYYYHEKYDTQAPVGPYDIGMIKLKTPLKLNERVSKIELSKKDSIHEGNAVLAGWGRTNPANKTGAKILQTATMPIVEQVLCNTVMEQYFREIGYPIKDPVHETNMCTGPLTGGISGCHGDSGGPLISKANGKTELIGIVSWGMAPCARERATSVYARVSAHIDWVADILAKH